MWIASLSAQVNRTRGADQVAQLGDLRAVPSGNLVRATSQHRRAFAQFALAGHGVSLTGRPVIVPRTGGLYGYSSGQRTPPGSG